MPDQTTEQGTAQQGTAQSPLVIVPTTLCQHDPPFFKGTVDQDVEDWLLLFERVSAANTLDDPSKLEHVPFYLKDVASLWLWAAFKTILAAVFGRPAVRKLHAKQCLRGCAQKQGENFTSYIEDVIDLCKRLNPEMTEQDKIRHILKGIDDDAFQMLLVKDPHTVSELVTLCQSFEELRKQRVSVQRSTTADGSLAALTVGGDNTLLAQIKEYVREEVARQLSCLSYLPTTEVPTNCLTLAVRQAIQEQVSEALPSASPPTPVATPLNYAAAVARPPRHLPVSPPQPVGPCTMPFSATPQHYGNPWRTADNRSICYACGIPGHVARLCCRRFAVNPEAPRYPDYSFRPPYRAPHMPPEVYECNAQAAPDTQTFASRRSASPSPSCHSVSPMRRRPTLTETEN